ncbi:T9SS type A sorting domain-containing protein [Hymenobacter volaticus]|uniref:T9SS type A sorting domain-containing protein n=1 Tax=Hymenobacter volaticus TaxID=2932254 RepID=A0ABY4G9Y3_9BACT|nr:T9SS type A sorting domain-containing protein [Hymenobacter volaticus]UOQ67384.1 T9SS type A sorting domain-containing protein [Hymenobacter volaticus]
MKTTLFKSLALVFALLTTALTVPARAGQPKDNHPVRREMQAYIEQNMLPVVRQQRQKLETQLATADKAQLAIYRTQLKEVRQRSQALRQSFRNTPSAAPNTTEPTSPRTPLSEAQQQQLQQLRTETRTIMQQVNQMAEKYASNISQVLQEVQPQKEKWATDMQAIVVKNTTPEQQEKLSHFRGGRMHHRVGAGRLLRPTAFLLLDPAAPTATPTTSDLGSTSLYPNPAVATNQLEYTVTKAGPVTVELLDGRGNTVRTVAQEVKEEKGVHTLQVHLADLPKGTYYYKITTRTGSETKRFVKE